MSSDVGSRASVESLWARRITDWLAPLKVVVGLLVVVAVLSTDSILAGLGWAALAATFCGLIPWGIVQLGIRRGRYADRHIADREKRPLPMLLALLAVVVGYVALSRLGAPEAITTLVLSMSAGLLVVLAVTLWWKVSVHAAVAAGAATVLAQSSVAGGLVAAIAVAAVAWSRIELRAHTWWQVAVGVALGASVAMLIPAAVAVASSR